MGILYIVATPIGNLEDITLRALRILREVGFIICEDTRVTSKLLNRHEIKKETLSYHQHSKIVQLKRIVARLEKEDAALVSDAGTPGIADPGGVMVEQCQAKGIQVIPIPGPATVATILSAAGFPADRFVFLGFPPHKKGRQTFFKNISSEERTVVFYESKHRIRKALQELSDSIGDRDIVVGRELTKKFEEILRGTALEILQKLEIDKGEFAVVVRQAS